MCEALQRTRAICRRAERRGCPLTTAYLLL